MLEISSGVTTCLEMTLFSRVIVSLAKVACAARCTCVKGPSTKGVST